MKKNILLLVLTLIMSCTYLQAQIFTCSGDYAVIVPKDGSMIKDCEVNVYETYAEINILDDYMIVPVYDTDTINNEIGNGKYWYLDRQKNSWIFYGYVKESPVCVVSICNTKGLLTFSRKIKKTSIN